MHLKIENKQGLDSVRAAVYAIERSKACHMNSPDCILPLLDSVRAAVYAIEDRKQTRS